MGIFSKGSNSYDFGYTAKSAAHDSFPYGISGTYLGTNNDSPLKKDSYQKVYSKATKVEIGKQLLLSDQDFSFYYKPMMRMFMLYLQSYSELVNARSVQINSDANRRVLYAKKFGPKEEYNNYNKLKERIEEVFSPEVLSGILRDLNKNLLLENNNKHLFDKIDYYTTFSNKEKFNLIAVPTIVFLALFASTFIPPVAAGVTVAASAEGIGILVGIMFAKSFTSKAARITYLSAIRNPKNLTINSEMLKNKINDPNLLIMKLILEDLNEICKKNGQFNFNFVNSFKHCALLKEKCDSVYEHLSKTSDSTLFLNQSVYDKCIPKIRESYYKTLYYSRSNKIQADTLHLQIESLKLTTLQSLKLLINNSEINGFMRSRDIGKNETRDQYTLGIIEKYITKSYKNLDKGSVNCLAYLIFITMTEINVKEEYIKNNNIIAEKKTKLAKSALGFFEDLSSKDELPRRVVNFSANSSSSSYSAFFSKINNSSALNAGGWVAFSILEGILYLKQGSLPNKYRMITKWMTRVASSIYCTHYILGTVNHITSWAGVSTCTYLANLSFSPFAIIGDIVAIKAGKMIEKHEAKGLGKKIEEFAKYKEEYIKNGEGRTPAYDFFVKNNSGNANTVLHKICHLFKENLNSISAISSEINDRTIKLTQNIKKLDAPSKGSFISFSHKVTEKEIIEKYTKIFIKILSLTKSIEAYEYYLDNVVDVINQEVDETLQLYFVLLCVKHNGVFSLVDYASKSNISDEIFNET